MEGITLLTFFQPLPVRVEQGGEFSYWQSLKFMSI